ncbi:MAG: hypothetical protein ABIG42_07370, partial [bacterium]
YQIFKVNIAAFPANQPPVPIIITNPAPPMIPSGGQISFDATTSYDPDGLITTYEWDFDFDGMEFVADETGAVPPVQTFTNPTSEPHMLLCLLRVTDNGNPPVEVITEVLVLVQPNSPPNAVIEVSPSTTFSECSMVTLDGSNSTDDGAIVKYEWDFDYDPENPDFHVDATGPIINRRFTPGNHDIMLRVSDDTIPALTNVTRERLTSEPLTGLPGEVAFCENLILNSQDSLNSHSFSGGGQKSAVLSVLGAVVTLWVDEGDVLGGPALKYSISTDGGRSFGNPLVANSDFIAGDSSILRPTLVSDATATLHLGYADGDGKFFYQQTDSQGVFSDPVEVGTGEYNYGGPAIAMDSSGAINYFFTGNLSAGNIPLRLAQSTDGGSSFDSPVTVVSDGRFPSATTGNSGSIVVAFEGKNSSLSDNSDVQVAYQRTGTIFYPPIRVVDSPANQGTSTHPVVNMASNGSVHVVWQDSRDGNTDTDYDIFYSYTLSGLSFNTNVKVNDTNETPGNQILQDNPSFGIDTLGRAFIAWRDFRNASGGNIYFSFSRMPGMPFNSNIRINDDSSSPAIVAQGPPSIVVSPNSGLLIIWADERNASSDLGTPFSGESDIYYLFGKLF